MTQRSMSGEELQKYLNKKTTEKQVQARIIAHLQLVGFSTPGAEVANHGSSKRGYFLVCGTTRRSNDHQGTMQTPGIADLWIWIRKRDLWLSIELKRPVGGVLTDEQRVLVEAGATTVARSVDEVMAEIERAEK